MTAGIYGSGLRDNPALYLNFQEKTAMALFVELIAGS